ncbi:MAG TPA: secondary thiamine-phosphate synthase enzyme YjbQ [Candidatus Limnocylindrales bacterium]|nr:secondary thiamine-phosphate synthase enzyme YjbQ [Candidatus Limnocylindrales bacterium]
MRVRSRERAELLDVTEAIEARVRSSGVESGICVVYVPHTTAGVLINENADPGVLDDVLRTLERLVPWTNGYRHIEDNAAAHIKAILVGGSQTIPVQAGRLLLGRWQGIYFAEFDGPRERQLRVTIAAG